MFYFFSKIFDVVLTPLAWAVVLVVAGSFAGRSRRWSRTLTTVGIAILLVLSLEPVSNAIFRNLESPARATVRPDVTYDVVILLGGLADDRIEGTWGQRAFNDNNERLLETFDLLRTGKAKNAILSGGAPSESRSRSATVEARTLADQLTSWGISPARLVVEERSRNTRENAVYSAAAVRARSFTTVLLVTSAVHMRRAYGCFRAVGLDVDTLPVDFRSYGPQYPSDWIPRADHFAESSAAIREWFGRIIYSVRGYSK